MASEKPGRGRRSPRQSRAQLTVNAILFAAAHILKTRGHERLTTNRIASLAGVSIGSVYQYFSDKQAIVDALRERHDAFYVAQVQRGIKSVAGSELRPSLEKMLRRMIDLHLSDNALHGELRGEANVMRSRQSEYVGRVRVYLEEHAAELRPIPDPDLTAFLVTKALEQLIHGVALDEPERLSHPHYVNELVELTMGYLGGE